MEITRFKDRGQTGTMLRVTTAEAMRLISTLALQVLSKSGNSHREEFYPQSDKGREYFSISVAPTPIPERQYGPNEMQDFDWSVLLQEGSLTKMRKRLSESAKKTRRKK
jgi:hypothetical protein